MGLFRAAKGAVDGVLANQWKEFISTRTLSIDELQLEGIAQVSANSSNTKRDENIITDGSIIMLGVGEVAIAVENGEILEIYTKPGEHIFHSERSKSIFSGATAIDLTEDAAERFTFAGQFAPVVQKVYYINVREIMGVEFDIPDGVPVRVMDENTGQDMDCTLIGNGIFSYRIVQPDVFYKNVSGNKAFFSTYDVEPQMKSEILKYLFDAVGKLSAENMRPFQTTDLIPEICNRVIASMNEFLIDSRGIAICSLAMPRCRLQDRDLNIIKQLQHDAVFKDGFYADDSISAEKQRERNLKSFTKADGAWQLNDLYSSHFDSSKYSDLFSNIKSTASSWQCDCGKINTGKFCEECGRPKK